MALTATYETTLSRVKLVASGLSENGHYATIERTSNGYQWQTVRGAVELPIGTGGTVTWYDYEFDPGEENTYRIRSVYDGAPVRISGGETDVSGDNASLTPVISSNTQPGDLVLVFATIRTFSAAVNEPAGYTTVFSTGNVAVFGKVAGAGEGNPLVTFTGGSAGHTTLAQARTFRGAGMNIHSYDLLSASGQNITVDSTSITATNWLALIFGHKWDDFTSTALDDINDSGAEVGWSNAGQVVSTAGNDAGQVVYWKAGTDPDPSMAAEFDIVVTGGGAANSNGLFLALEPADYLNEFTDSVTPTPAMPWLKSVTRPFLNTEVTVGNWSSISAEARGSLFQVVGRSAPVAVTDVRGSKSFQIEIMTNGLSQRTRLEYLMAAGDVLLLQPPAGDDCGIPAGYYWVKSYSEERRARRTERRVFVLDVQICAAPGPDVAAYTSTWGSIVSSFDTWADVLAAFPTWQDVMEYIADPETVYVP